MFLPKVNKSLALTVTKNITKVVASVLLATTTIGTANVALASEQNTEIQAQERVHIAGQPIVFQQFTQMSLGAAYHYSHRSHYSHSSHRSHYSHYSGY